ncbi:hypothetical protein [Hyphomonas sp.]|uniref:hypothetical protein n=1 Tax=Hyphomonas sp. TaxID=87 RepID=UPI000C897775|nr:hypothetical protein [Hyphomonas sp.]MAL47084.1 hypothetical protein [Hyphomonas sp.]|tara:strand:+ start:87 stop:953 length:867 start_codon:yes stop_codon:yes gene_type:complete
MSKLVNEDYPKTNKSMSDNQLKKIAEAQYRAEEAAKTSEARDYPTEIVELPSKGKFYPEGHPLATGKIEMKYMTAKEEDILSNQSYVKSGVVLDKLFKALIVTPVDYNDLLLGDKNAIMVAARVLGYGKDYEISVVDDDGNTQKEIVDLTKLEDKEIDWSRFEKENAFEYELPVSKRKITVQHLTHGIQRKIDAELKGLAKLKKAPAELTTRLKYTITSIDGNDDSSTIRKFVDNELLAIDSRALRKFIETITPDIDLSVDCLSEETGEPFRGKVGVGLDFFWPDFEV